MDKIQRVPIPADSFRRYRGFAFTNVFFLRSVATCGVSLCVVQKIIYITLSTTHTGTCLRFRKIFVVGFFSDMAAGCIKILYKYNLV